MIDLILEYAPYALTILNALISFLIYRRTGKMRYQDIYIGKDNDNLVVSELKTMLDYHKKSVEELEKSINAYEVPKMVLGKKE